jgi:hypothetical protein
VISIFGSFLLVGAIFGGSSIGVLSNFIPPNQTNVKNAWRGGLNVCYFILPAILEFIFFRQ